MSKDQRYTEEARKIHKQGAEYQGECFCFDCGAKWGKHPDLQDNHPKKCEAPAHEAVYEELLALECPKCKKPKPINWGELENNTLHKCPSCNYIWKIV